MSGEPERTEKPTPKRLKEARKEGQVARTPDLGAWAGLLVWTMLLPAAVGAAFDRLFAITNASLRAVESPTPEVALRLLGDAMTQVFVALLLLGVVGLVIGVGAALAQGGFFVATKAVKPTLSKLNPIKGAKRIFGGHALWEGAKVLLKSSVVGFLVYRAIVDLMPLLGGDRSLSTVLGSVADHAISLLRIVAVAGLVMAALDYAVQRRRTGKQTRMTKDEVRREHKQTDGDPLVKNAMRARQRAAGRNRMIADVPNADVVLVNPTHVAVALRYDPESGAPTVVARGAGVIATPIREVATEHRVPLVRDVALARALHSSTEVGQQIPAELFAAVAQVLAFVINRRSRGHGGGEHRSPRPADADLPAVPRAGRRRRNLSGAASDGR